MLIERMHGMITEHMFFPLMTIVKVEHQPPSVLATDHCRVRAARFVRKECLRHQASASEADDQTTGHSTSGSYV